MKTVWKKVGIVVVGVFAIIGVVFSAVFVGMQFGIFNVRGSIDQRNKFFLDGQNTASSTVQAIQNIPCVDKTKTLCAWNETPEWAVIKNGLQKDDAILTRVSQETGVSKRMIATVVIPEQARFFTSNREVFKRYFEPMKILGSMTQFSLGVSGIKEKTAKQIEEYASDPTSEFYPGAEMEKLIGYSPKADRNKELFNRLTDDKNHYYSYLYTAIFVKEIQSQWQKAGFDISQKPEVVATLFNIGFEESLPKANPVVGGASISLGGRVYPYGQIGTNFYYSDELADIFPRE